MTGLMKWYIGALAAASALLLVGAGVSLPERMWVPLAIATVLASALELSTMELPSGTQFTLGSAVYFTVYLVYGIEAALWVVTISALSTSYISKVGISKTLFNWGQYMVSVAAADLTYRGVLYLAGVDPQLPGAYQMLAVTAFITADFLVNTGLLSVVFWQLSGDRIFQVWKGLVIDAYLGHFAVMTLGYVASDLLRYGGGSAMGFVLALLFLQRLFAIYFRLLRASRARERILDTILNTTDNGILMLDNDDRVAHANSKAADLLDAGGVNLVGAAFSDLVHGDDGTDCGPDGPGWRLQAADRSLRLTRSPVTGSGPNPGSVVTLTDVTLERQHYHASIRTLIAAVDARDETTHGHSERVAEYSVRLGQLLRLSQSELSDLRYGGLLHDIGKIGIDDRILRKAGALTAEEWDEMRQHPVKGVAILSQARVFESIIPIVLYHHERYGGNGYPTGRRGDSIPLGARIIGVADAFDSMTSHRHYRPGMPVERALEELMTCSGSQFDPEAARAFVLGLQAGDIPVLPRPGASTQSADQTRSPSSNSPCRHITIPD